MSKFKLELQTGYIADAIIETKKKRFNEEFTTIDEVNIMKDVIRRRIQQQGLTVKFIDAFFKNHFNIIDGVITKSYKAPESLKIYISDLSIREAIYDENLIYLCLCEIWVNKLTCSMEHTCINCTTNCSGSLYPEQPTDCAKWTHSFSVDNNQKLSLRKE